MTRFPSATCAFFFVPDATGEHPEGYAAAADEMVALAAAQPGYRGIDSTRGADGIGITVSYWADEAAAVAWRRHARHGEIREAGRGRWYRWYSLHVAEVGRSYDWEKE